MILVIIGPSGSGKSSVAKALTNRGLIVPHATWTDRPARDGETDSLEHHFVSEDAFTRLMEEGFFIDTVEFFGHRYGMAYWPNERQGILTVILRSSLVDYFRAVAAPEQVVVYQICCDRRTVESRLRRRNLSAIELSARLAEYCAETGLGAAISTRSFFNEGDLAELVDEVEAALLTDLSLETPDELVLR